MLETENETVPTSDSTQPPAGSVITPYTNQAAASQPAGQITATADQPTRSDQSGPTTEASVAQRLPETESPAPLLPEDNLNDSMDESLPDTPDGDSQSITWMASEFVHHEKSTGWYIMLAVGSLLLAALVFILAKDAVSVGVVIVAGLLLGTYGAHQPRQIKYRLDNRGIGVGAKYYGYDEFRSFSIVPEGVFSSIVFMPLKRFGLPTTIYFAPDDEERILAVLADKLPFEPHKHDAVDRLIRRMRF